MKEKILNILHGEPQLEPVYQLEFEYRKMDSEMQKNEFLHAIKNISMNGTDFEKFLSLTLIDILGKANECEDAIKFNVENIQLNENEKKISPLLFLSASIASSWSIRFIKKVMQQFKPITHEYVYYFDLSIRSIINTNYWKDSIEEIIWALENYGKTYVIDTLAYFKWKRNPNDEKELFELIRHKPNLLNKINTLRVDIEERYNTNYKGM